MTGKKLMNEVLPAPVVAPKNGPRDRVLRHMRDALAAGASVALLTGCPFAVVDPLPPPAACRSMGADKLATVTVTRIDVDGGVEHYEVVVTLTGDSGLTLNQAMVTNGTLVSSLTSREFVVAPASGATSFDIVIAADCSDNRMATRKLGLRIIVTLGVNGPTASVAEVPAP